jgi:glutamyl-Q tRNA(Asp) synthetase
MSLRTRFAPSPTGRLHLGHAASALFIWDWAAREGAEVLLRIEDIDPVRCKPEFTAEIFEDLHWLGLDWPQPVRRQSQHLSDYADVIETLAARGLVYRCFKSRSEISEDIARAPHGRPVYLGPEEPLSEDEEAHRLSGGEPFSWRLSIAAARDVLGTQARDLQFSETGNDPSGIAVPVDLEVMGDVILARKDTPTSYHLACTHDDALQGVTHVIRGTDLCESTHVHVLLQALMGWTVPVYLHHPLKTGPDGRRFAKRDKSQTLRALREGGMSAAEVRRLAAF